LGGAWQKKCGNGPKCRIILESVCPITKPEVNWGGKEIKKKETKRRRKKGPKIDNASGIPFITSVRWGEKRNNP